MHRLFRLLPRLRSTRVRHSNTWLAVLLACALSACTGDAAPSGDGSSAAEGELRVGTYRATLALPGGELPFGLEIAREGGQYVAYLVNGSERVRVPEVTVADGRIEMIMPGLRNTLSARITRTGLEGEVVLVKLNEKNQHIPFAAEYGATHRFIAQPEGESADLSGRWSVTFTEESGKQYQAVGEFTQRGHELTGTFLTPTGDHRFLAGDVEGDEFALSTFDGARAFLYRGRINRRGEMEGTYWSGLAWQERFVGRRDDSATLAQTETTALRDGADSLDFTFPDLDGNPVSLSDPRFASKVIVITLAGSWCPNCHDEAAFLAPYYLRNRDRGLEVISLMFEHFGDFDQAVAATRRFRERYDIRYTTLIAGVSDKEQAAQKLPQLNGIYAFPTTLFLDRQGRVRKIHTGFAGPATGEHYQRLIEEFDSTIEQLLAETGESVAEHRPDGA
ncbi:MAG: TlpA disulfide reductase family protein [Pseudomonadota bacterium]|jgi:peroxiredoxin|nr:MAG: TlpA family protein disulfide reductase [Pseudomonadota bacterium]